MTGAAAPAAAPPAPPATGGDAPTGDVTQQTADQQAAQAEAAEQTSPEKPAELSDKAANEDEAAHEKAAKDILEGGLQEPKEPEAKEEATAETPAEETTAEATEETPEATEQTEETTQQGISTLATSLFPDREITSDQEATEAITEFVTEAREYRDKQEGATKRLAELFRSNPDLVDLIHLMNEGASMSDALPYVTGEADGTGIEDAKEGWQKSAAEKRKAKAEQDKALQETSKNLEVSVQNIKKFADENNMSDQEAGEFLDTVDDIMSNISRGNITGEMMTKLLKGLRHDKVVADETDKAEIRGKNEGIKEVTAKKAEMKGDGLPHPKSKATDSAEKETVDTPDDLLGRNIDHFTGSRKF